MGNETDGMTLGLIKDRSSSYYNRFLDFIKNVLILFKQNFKEVMLFILFCTVVNAVISNILSSKIPVISSPFFSSSFTIF